MEFCKGNKLIQIVTAWPATKVAPLKFGACLCWSMLITINLQVFELRLSYVRLECILLQGFLTTTIMSLRRKWQWYVTLGKSSDYYIQKGSAQSSIFELITTSWDAWCRSINSCLFEVDFEFGLYHFKAGIIPQIFLEMRLNEDIWEVNCKAICDHKCSQQ